MWKVIRILALVAVVAAGVTIGACAFRVHHYDKALDEVVVGDSEAEVIARLGTPSFREAADAPYLRYTSRACATPCNERLWWEWPIAPGIEAWSVELGHDRKVLRTYHWVSP
jgi:hypothetical protein